MKRKHLLFTLLLALVVPLAANAQVSFPFDEDFDDNALLGTLPDGWSSSTLAGQGTVEVVRQTNPLRQYLAFTVTGLNNNGRGGVQVQIPTNAAGNWYKAVSFKLMAGVNAGAFSIGYFTPDNNAFPPTQTWTLIATYDASDFTPGTWQSFTVPVALQSGQTLAFRTNTTTANTAWAIDDLSISDEGLVPTNLAANASQNSATITWDANLASNWQLQYRVLGDMNWSTSIPATTNSYTRENLQPGTTYEVHVRARINGLNRWFYSSWSESLSFITTAPVAVPYPGLGHEIFSGLHFNMPDIYLPDNWNGTVSPAEAGKIQTHYEAPNPNLPNFKEGWLRMEVTGNPNMNNPVTLTAALPVFDQPVNLLKTRLLIRPSSTVNSYCGNLLLGYIMGNDLSTFTTLETYSASGYSTTEYTMVEKVITGIPANARLAICYAADYVNQQNSYWDVDYYMDADGMVSEVVPTNFQLASHTDNTATFTWDAITGATYELQSKTFDKATNEWGDWAVVDAVSTNSYTLENLSRRYRYYARVRAVGYDDQNNPYYGSTYTDEASYFPGEEMVTEFPFSFHFSWPYISNPEVNNLYQDEGLWYYYNASTSTNTIHTKYGDAIYRYLPNNNLRNLVFCVAEEGNEDYQPQPQYLISPKIQGLSTKQMVFSGEGFRQDGEEEIDLTVEVGVMTDPMDPSTFQLIRTVTMNGQHAYDDDLIYFYTFGGQEAHVAIKVPVTDKRSFVRIEDVRIDVAPTCKPIRNLAVVENSLTAHSVGLTWERQDESQWEIQYKRLPIVGEEDWQSVIIDEYPYTLTGLMGNNRYKIRVRSYCGTDEQGDWSNEIEIRTDCGEFENLPYYENFDNTGPTTWPGGSATIGYGYNPMPQCYYTDNEETAYVRTDLHYNGSEVWSEHSLELYPIAYTGPNVISRVYLPKMNNLKQLRIRFSAKAGNHQEANISPGTFLNVYVCDHYTDNLSECVIIGSGQFMGTPVLDPTAFVLTREYQEFTLYTTSQDQFDEGYIMFYSNNPCPGELGCKGIVDIDWIEVTVFDYNKHFTGAISTSWDNYNNWDPVGIPTAEDNVYLNDGLNVIIPANLDAEVNAINFDSDRTTLTIKDGGSLKFNMGQSHQSGAQNLRVLNVTMEKNVQAYTPGINDHYCLLAVPASNFNDHIIYSLDFFTNSVYDPNYINTDLYTFDPSQELEWRNWKSNALFLNWGYGALYASAVDKQLSFNIRTVVPADFPIDVTQPVHNPNATFYRWALLGNPYTCEAYIRDASSQVVIDGVTQYWYFPYYITNAAGDALVLAPSSRPIKPMEGVFVQGWPTGITHYMFTPEIETPNRGQSFDLTVRKANTRSADVLDRARIQLGEGFDFEHCDLLPSPNRLYIPGGDKQLSVAHAGTIGEMPLNFEAAANGTYTIAFEAEDLDFSYLHLIDNLTGADVNLLEVPEYNFSAKTTDYASRFKLVFATGSSEGTEADTFGFINASGNFCIFGIESVATVQVIDLLGHVISSETFSGSYERKINGAPGVYLVRLINGNDVKVQKVVVR